MDAKKLEDALGGRQNMFLVLSILVVIIIIMLSPDIKTAIIPITLITNVLIISTQTMHIDNSKRENRECRQQQNTVSAVAPWTMSGFQDEPDKFASRDFTKDTSMADMTPLSYSVAGPPGYGPTYSPMDMQPGTHVSDRTPMELNPYQLNTVASRGEPWGSPETCGAFGDNPYAEARNTFDGDRQVVEHAKWRNDPYRPLAGRAKKQELIKKYMGEEIDEEENRQWWGNWDY